MSFSTNLIVFIYQQTSYNQTDVVHIVSSVKCNPPGIHSIRMNCVYLLAHPYSDSMYMVHGAQWIWIGKSITSAVKKTINDKKSLLSNCTLHIE